MKAFVKYLTLVAAVLLIAVSCGKKFEMPQAGCYYNVETDGAQYFVWLDTIDQQGSAAGHFYAVKDTVAERHDFTAAFNRRNVVISSDGSDVRIKYGKVSYALYQEPLFEEKDSKIYRQQCCGVNVKNDIVYGHAQGYWSSLEGVEQEVFKVFTKGYVKSFKKRDLDLALDLYRPEGVAEKRPLIVFIHGGAFYIGYKDEPAYVDFCKYFASIGYVTASINYRLGFHISKNEIERAGYIALQDAHAAIRYLVAHADEYGIDPERIFVAGSSAGGITALNLAFMQDDDRPQSSRGKKAFLSNKADLGDIESSGNDLKAKFKIKAIANMWGAVSDIDMLKNGKTSIVSFHGDADNTVPYAEGYPLSSAGEGVAKMLSEVMYGSVCIDRKAEELGIRHKFYPFPGEKHAFNTEKKTKLPNKNHEIIKGRINEFFFEELIPDPAAEAHIAVPAPGCYKVEGAGVTDVQWKVDGGFVLRTSPDNSIAVAWCDDKPHALAATGTYGNEIGWTVNL